MNTTTSHNFKSIRSAMRITQQQLAERLSVSIKTIGAIEEERMPPSPATLSRLTLLTGISGISERRYSAAEVARGMGIEIYDRTWLIAAISRLRAAGVIRYTADVARDLGKGRSSVAKYTSPTLDIEPPVEFIEAFQLFYKAHLSPPTAKPVADKDTIIATLQAEIVRLNKIIDGLIGVQGMSVSS